MMYTEKDIDEHCRAVATEIVEWQRENDGTLESSIEAITENVDATRETTHYAEAMHMINAASHHMINSGFNAVKDSGFDFDNARTFYDIAMAINHEILASQICEYVVEEWEAIMEREADSSME